MTYKRFIFAQPIRDIHKEIVLDWINKNRSIIAGPAKVGYYNDDHVKAKYSVVIPINARHLPAMEADQPEPIKFIFPISLKHFNLVSQNAPSNCSDRRN